MCWTICKASIFDWIKKTPTTQPNHHQQKTYTLHPPPLPTRPVSYFHVIIMEGAEAEEKEYCDMLRCFLYYNCKASFLFCFVFNFLWPFPFYSVNFFSFGSITCQVIYHLISEFFTGVSARGALLFPLGYRFYFNKLYWWFPWQKRKTTWKRMCTSLFSSKPVFV